MIRSGRNLAPVLRDLRRTLHWSESDMAGVLGVTVGTVQSWERGHKPVPRSAHKRFRYLLIEVGERLEELSGIERCEWLDVWQEEDQSALLASEVEDRMVELDRHMNECQQCIELSRYIDHKAGHLHSLLAPRRSISRVDWSGLFKVAGIAAGAGALLYLLG